MHNAFRRLATARQTTPTRWRSLLLALSAASLVTGCGAQAMEMNVVVFNYWPRALADVYVNGQWVGGGYGGYTEAGGTGSKVSCCYKIAPGKVEVKWMLDGPSADPLTGKTMSSSTELVSIKPNADYLGVYLYPDGTVALDTTRGIPDDKLSEARR